MLSDNRQVALVGQPASEPSPLNDVSGRCYQGGSFVSHYYTRNDIGVDETVSVAQTLA
jgi:hypothetical protein